MSIPELRLRNLLGYLYLFSSPVPKLWLGTHLGNLQFPLFHLFPYISHITPDSPSYLVPTQSPLVLTSSPLVLTCLIVPACDPASRYHI
jgi:hypothetical protein